MCFHSGGGSIGAAVAGEYPNAQIPNTAGTSKPTLRVIRDQNAAGGDFQYMAATLNCPLALCAGLQLQSQIEAVNDMGLQQPAQQAVQRSSCIGA